MHFFSIPLSKLKASLHLNELIWTGLPKGFNNSPIIFDFVLYLDLSEI